MGKGFSIKVFRRGKGPWHFRVYKGRKVVSKSIGPGYSSKSAATKMARTLKAACIKLDKRGILDRIT